MRLFVFRGVLEPLDGQQLLQEASKGKIKAEKEKAGAHGDESDQNRLHQNVELIDSALDLYLEVVSEALAQLSPTLAVGEEKQPGHQDRTVESPMGLKMSGEFSSLQDLTFEVLITSLKASRLGCLGGQLQVAKNRGAS